MMCSKKVVWYEGMCLHPQHFQQQERYFEHLLQQRAQKEHGYPWGFMHFAYHVCAHTRVLYIDHAEGFFPDGTYFSMPNRDPCPPPITVAPTQTGRLYLGIKQRAHAHRDSCFSKEAADCRYHIDATELEDSVDENKHAVSVSLGTLVCQILTDNDNLDQYSALAFLRWIPSDHAEKTIVDEPFIPPMLCCHDAPPLNRCIPGIYTHITQQQAALTQQLFVSDHMEQAATIDLLLLQLFNRYVSLFAQLAHVPNVHPQTLYHHVHLCLAELATFTADKRVPESMVPYQHDDLATCLIPMVAQLNKQLSECIRHRAVSVPLIRQSTGLWHGVMTDARLFSNTQFVLVIQAHTDTTQTAQHDVSRIKVAPIDAMAALITKSLPGFALKVLAHPPRHIPYQARHCYIAIVIDDTKRQQSANARGLAIHVGTETPPLAPSLWVIKGVKR